MIYLLMLIRDLDNPFGYHERGSGEDVSLKPLEDATSRAGPDRRHRSLYTQGGCRRSNLFAAWRAPSETTGTVLPPTGRDHSAFKNCISPTDSTLNALIGFHVRPVSPARSSRTARRWKIRKYNIIYDAVEDIRSAMEGMLKPELKEEQIGTVEVATSSRFPGRHDRGPSRHAGEGPAQLGRAPHPGQRRGLQGQDLLAEAVQGRRPGRWSRGFECGIASRTSTTSRSATSSRPTRRGLARKIEASRDGGAQT